jgi:hypothetical protein
VSSEVDVLLASLKGQYGWVLAFTSWVTCLRLVFSFVNARLKEFAEQALPAEAAGIQRLLDSLPWRILVFTVNVLTSVKLPTEAKGPPRHPAV